jgi:hypothetical protein
MNNNLGGHPSNKVASGTFRLNGRFFDDKKLAMNKHKLALSEQVSYPTIHKYISRDEQGSAYDVRNFSGDVLYAILVKGMGYTAEQVRDLRLGDVFEIVEEPA